MTGSSVVALQQALTQLGYDPGTADGVYGSGDDAGGEGVPGREGPDPGRSRGPGHAHRDQRAAREGLTPALAGSAAACVGPPPARVSGRSSAKPSSGNSPAVRKATSHELADTTAANSIGAMIPIDSEERLLQPDRRAGRVRPGDLGGGDEGEAVPRQPDPAGDHEHRDQHVSRGSGGRGDDDERAGDHEREPARAARSCSRTGPTRARRDPEPAHRAPAIAARTSAAACRSSMPRPSLRKRTVKLIVAIWPTRNRALPAGDSQSAGRRSGLGRARPAGRHRRRRVRRARAGAVLPRAAAVTQATGERRVGPRESFRVGERRQRERGHEPADRDVRLPDPEREPPLARSEPVHHRAAARGIDARA